MQLKRPIAIGAIITACLLLHAPRARQATQLCVDAATGDDSRTKATVAASFNGTTNTCSAPWASIMRAARGSSNRATPSSAQAADEADTVYIAAGTYNYDGQATILVDGPAADRWDVTYNPVNSGSSGSPIRFVAQGTVVLTHTAGTYGPVIGSSQQDDGTPKDYIEWIGNFSMSYTNGIGLCDSGMVTFYGESGDYVQGGLIDGATMVGRPDLDLAGCLPNNYGGVRLEYTNGVTIRNNTISGFGSSGGDDNHTGVTLYKTSNPTIENNTFTNNATAIYAKAVEYPGVNFVGTSYFRKNRISGGLRGIVFHRWPATSSEPSWVTQNIITGTDEYCIEIAGFTQSDPDPVYATYPVHIKIINNTLADCGQDAFKWANVSTPPTSSGNLLWNNIIAGPSAYAVNFDHAGMANTNTFDAEHNLYNGTTTFAQVGAPNVSFGTWQTSPGHDNDDGGAGGDGSTSSPSFVGGGDYHLQPGSAALTVGRVHPTYSLGGSSGATIPAGAYITGSETIGPSSSTTTAPGVRIRFRQGASLDVISSEPYRPGHYRRRGLAALVRWPLLGWELRLAAPHRLPGFSADARLDRTADSARAAATAAARDAAGEHTGTNTRRPGDARGRAEVSVYDVFARNRKAKRRAIGRRAWLNGVEVTKRCYVVRLYLHRDGRPFVGDDGEIATEERRGRVVVQAA